LNLARSIVVLGFAPILSFCEGMCGQCVCHDGVPPTWQTILAFDDLGSRDSQPLGCTATATRGANVIELEFHVDEHQTDPVVCTKTGGDALNDAGRDVCGGHDYERYGRQLEITLDPNDETFLGGFDFDLAIVCNGNTIRQTHEIFATSQCEC
jgi:hypothetical protein